MYSGAGWLWCRRAFWGLLVRVWFYTKPVGGIWRTSRGAASSTYVRSPLMCFIMKYLQLLLSDTLPPPLPVFFNHFSKAEPLAAILIVHGHGTHVFFGGTPEAQTAVIWGRRPRGGWGSLEGQWALLGRGLTSYRVWESTVTSHSGVRPLIHVGPTKSLENASSGCKCWTQFNFYWALAVPRNSWIALAEPLGSTEPRLKNAVLPPNIILSSWLRLERYQAMHSVINMQ